MEKDEPLISLRNVSKTYRMGTLSVPALRKMNLEILAGDFAALVGPSGSGKTSLLNVIGCLDDWDEGEVFFRSQSLRGLNEGEKSRLRSSQIGFVFQSFNLIPVLSALENVELPLLLMPKLKKEERISKAKEALRQVGLEDWMKSRPDQLSGGQRQRVAIARALVTNPQLILADEPTANLDSVTSHKIIDLMLELNEKKSVTFLFSTHDEKLMGRVRRIIRIRDGALEVPHA